MTTSKNMLLGLLAVAVGVGVAAMVIPYARARRPLQAREESARVDEASEDSFPASDPPSFSAPTTAAGSSVS